MTAPTQTERLQVLRAEFETILNSCMGGVWAERQREACNELDAIIAEGVNSDAEMRTTAITYAADRAGIDLDTEPLEFTHIWVDDYDEWKRKRKAEGGGGA